MRLHVLRYQYPLLKENYVEFIIIHAVTLWKHTQVLTMAFDRTKQVEKKTLNGMFSHKFPCFFLRWKRSMFHYPSDRKLDLSL